MQTAGISSESLMTLSSTAFQEGRRLAVSKPRGLEQAATDVLTKTAEDEFSNGSPLSDFMEDPVGVAYASLPTSPPHCSASPLLVSA